MLPPRREDIVIRHNRIEGKHFLFVANEEIPQELYEKARNLFYGAILASLSLRQAERIIRKFIPLQGQLFIKL